MIDLGTSYSESRRRLTALVEALPDGDAESTAVACCPGWTVHDVVAHLTAVAEDAVAGRLTGPPSDEESAAQVARWSEVPTRQVLDAWNAAAPALEKLLAEVPIWPALMDVLSHEHDVRAAIGAPGARDVPAIQVCARRLVKGLVAEVPVVVTMDGEEFRGEPADGETGIWLETRAWEAFRFRLGRRSRRQLEAMSWTGDPSPIVDRLIIFGPSPVDIIE